MKNDAEEINYDEMIDYELSLLNNDDFTEDNLLEIPFLDNNINEKDSLETVLEKISNTHEDFYKMCLKNITADEELENTDNKNAIDLEEKTKQILYSVNLTYEDFVSKLSKIENDLDNGDNGDNDTQIVDKVGQTLSDIELMKSPFQDLMDHEMILQKMNSEKWNEYEKFYQDFGNRCNSARSISQKKLQDEFIIEKTKRQDMQEILDKQLKDLEETMKLEENDNKLRLLELEKEIEEEKIILTRLQNEKLETFNLKNHWAAIMIQKTFRRYQIRKRIGPQIDAARQSALRKLFNTKLIMKEKEAQKQKAKELRKWRKQTDKTKNDINIQMENVIVKNNEVRDIEECKNNIEKNNVENKTKKENKIKKTKIISNSNENIINITNNIHDSLTVVQSNDEEININKLKEEISCDEMICEKNIYQENEMKNEYDTTIDIKTFSFVEVVNNDKDYCENKSVENDDENLDCNFLDLITSQNNNNNISDCTWDTGKEILNDLLTDETMNTYPLINHEVEEVSYSPYTSDNITLSHSHKVSDDNVVDNYCSIDGNNYIEPSFDMILGHGDKLITSSKTFNEEHCCTESLNDKITKREVEETDNESNGHMINEMTKEVGQSNIKEECNNNVKCIAAVDNVDRNISCEEINVTKECLNIQEQESKSNVDNENICDNNVDNELSYCDSDQMNNDYTNTFLKSQMINDNNNISTMQINNNISTIQIYNNISINQDQISTINNNNNDCIHEAMETNEYKIDDEYLNNIFKGNSKIMAICKTWMIQQIDKNNVISEQETSNNCENIIPIIPKHLDQLSNLSFDWENIMQNNIIMEPSESLPESYKSLSIINQELGSINHLKDKFPCLEYLTMNRNSLKSFHSSDVPNTIKYLNIENNNLEWSYFGSSVESHLTILSFSHNDLCNLPKNAFLNCINIVQMDFSNNNFLSIESIFEGSKPLRNLCFLNLNNNVLSDINGLDRYCPNLTHLSLSGNHLKQWTNENKFSFLVDCDLSHNSIVSLQIWSNTPILIKLNLSHNAISDINLFCNSWMPCLSTLSLDSNKLTNILEICFPNLQNFSVQKNYLNESINYEILFQNCPMLTYLNVKENVGLDSFKNRVTEKKIIKSDNYCQSNIEIPCPDGVFSNACFDFADSFQYKSSKLMNFLRDLSNVGLVYKHQFYYYRSIRESVEEFYSYLKHFLFQIRPQPPLIPEIKNTKVQCEAAKKIQSLWKGFKTRKWYKTIISNIKLETETGFEELDPVDLSEFETDNHLYKWNLYPSFHKPTDAWIENMSKKESISMETQYKISMDNDNSELIIPGSESTCRSNSSTYLNKKGMDIMKEWGFEDPNSALWMMERAKKFQKKSINNSRPIISDSNKQPNLPKSSQIINQHLIEMNNKKVPIHERYSLVPSINTLTINPPSSQLHTNYQSKIDEWLVDNNFSSNIPQDKKDGFLPLIDSDNHLKKFSSNLIRPKSSIMKLPSINYVSGHI